MSGLLQVKEFLLILFFSKIVLLTPDLIDIFGEVELNPQEPLTAITSGASIEIDVSSMITKPREEGILEFDYRMKEAFPAGTIEARLLSKDKRDLLLRYNGTFAYSKDVVILNLVADNGVPTDIEFERVLITSRIKLKSVTVSWRNHKY